MTSKPNNADLDDLNEKSDPDTESGNKPTKDSTDRSCYMMVTNSTGLKPPIENLSLTHTSVNVDVINEPILNDGASSYKKQITFQTGLFPDRDYWNISFEHDGHYYDTPYNDRCNIGYDDAGQTVNCIITNASGSDFNLNVQTPQTDGCNFVIKRKS